MFLNMSSNKIKKLPYNIFKNMSKLKMLDISHNHLEILDEWGLESLSLLEFLKIDGNRFRYIQDIKINTVSLKCVWISLSGLDWSQICSLDKIIRPSVVKKSLTTYFNSVYLIDTDYEDCMLTWYYLKKMIRFNIFEDYKLFSCIDELKYVPIGEFNRFCS